jgi:ABC-type transport system involved in multi-copper enzyme maturation permease subunit
MQAWSKRIVAIAFIILILLGNIWLISLVTHTEAPVWTAKGFYICIVLTILGGLGMLCSRLFHSESET